MTRLFLKPRPKEEPKLEAITRSKAIAVLRFHFLKDLENSDGDTSMCVLAAQRGIFCHGFSRYGDGEIRRTFDWIVRKNPALSRDEIEQIANRWQIARQEAREMPLACDVQQREHDTCRGWDDFSNEQLGVFVKEVTGREYEVV